MPNEKPTEKALPDVVSRLTENKQDAEAFANWARRVHQTPLDPAEKIIEAAFAQFEAERWGTEESLPPAKE